MNRIVQEGTKAVVWDPLQYCGPGRLAVAGVFEKWAGTAADCLRSLSSDVPCCAMHWHAVLCFLQAALDAESRHQLESAVSRAAAAAATLKEAKVRQRHGAVGGVVGFARGKRGLHGWFAGHEGGRGGGVPQCCTAYETASRQQTGHALQSVAKAEGHSVNASIHAHPSTS